MVSRYDLFRGRLERGVYVGSGSDGNSQSLELFKTYGRADPSKVKAAWEQALKNGHREMLMEKMGQEVNKWINKLHKQEWDVMILKT
jgi:hypothetical protein